MQHFGEISQNIWVFFYNHQDLHPSEILYTSLGMLWISILPELDCKDFKSMPNAASIVIQFSVVLEAVRFPSHTIFNSLSDISSLQHCIISYLIMLWLKEKGLFLTFLLWTCKDCIFVPGSAIHSLHLAELYWKVKELLKPASWLWGNKCILLFFTEVINSGKSLHCLCQNIEYQWYKCFVFTQIKLFFDRCHTDGV